MTPNPGVAITATDVFKALGDPIRWSIVQQMAEVDELACSTLEETLPISKPTISYHTKILVQAGLISVRKEGRNFYYTLRREVLRELIDEVWNVVPEPRLVREGKIDHQAGAARRRRRSLVGGQRPAAVGETAPQREAVLLTW
jgi:DNA-binding transcriptional ArsR family regulator